MLSETRSQGDKKPWVRVRKDSELLTETRASAKASRHANHMPNGFQGQPRGHNFSQYSGHITVNSTTGKSLYYYFAEAMENPSSKPLMLWLNGGPGCSSLGFGALMEVGPWQVNSDNKTLHVNSHSWNKVANMLFLESPVGVGFSYSKTTSDYETLGDAVTAEDSYAFLVNWLQRFPEYQNRTFYIVGESYAGRYIPELADLTIYEKDIGQGSFMNFKGLLVINGVIDPIKDSEGMIKYPWEHALISDETYYAISENCKYTNQSYEFSNIELCDQLYQDFDNEAGNINLYNIYYPVCHLQNPAYKPPPPNTAYMVPGYEPCHKAFVLGYLNRIEVQQALHVNSTRDLGAAWFFCAGDTIGFNKSQGPFSMVEIYHKLIQRKYKILIMSGDTDSIVPVTSTRESLKLLKLPVIQKWSHWISDSEVGGYKIEYQGLTFATVRGAGHEVPLHQPSRAFTLLEEFLAK